MAVIKNLDILLGARTEGLDKGLKSGIGMISGFTKKAEGMGAGAALSGGFNLAAGAAMRFLPVIGAVAAGYAGLTSAANSFASAAERVDKLGNQADKLGMDIEAYQRLQYAVTQSADLNAEAFGVALQTMTRGVSQAANDMGKAKAVLEELKLDIGQLNAMSPDEQFYAIAQAMEQVANQNDRVRMGIALWGNEGVELLNTINGGAESLAASMADADRLGLVLTRSQANGVEQMMDQWARMGDYVDAIWNQITAAAAPTLTAIMDMFLDNTTSATTFGDAAAWVFDMINQSIAMGLNLLSVFHGAWQGLQGVVMGMVTAVMEIPKWIEKAVNYVKEMSGLGETTDTWQNAFDSMAASTGEKMRQAGQSFSDGFTGRAGQAFLDRIDEIHKAAADAEASAAERAAARIEQLPDPAPAKDIAGPRAAAAGTAEAASIINQIRKESPEKAIREVGARQEAALARLERVNTQQLAALRSGNAVLVPVGGG